MSHIYRQADAGDITEIQRLAHIIWQEAYGSILSAEQREYMLEMMYSERVIRDELGTGTIWEIILCEDRPCGFLSYLCVGSDAVKLSKIYIDKDSRGGSIAADALRRVIDYAAQMGRAYVFLTVNKNNQRAIRAYKKNGFAISDSVVTDIGNGFVMDDFIMKYRISGNIAMMGET